jgi:chromosome segregation ATPase
MECVHFTGAIAPKVGGRGSITDDDNLTLPAREQDIPAEKTVARTDVDVDEKPMASGCAFIPLFCGPGRVVIDSMHQKLSDAARRLREVEDFANSCIDKFGKLKSAYNSQVTATDELFNQARDLLVNNRSLSSQLAQYREQEAMANDEHTKHLVSREVTIHFNTGNTLVLYPSEEEPILKVATLLALLQPTISPAEFAALNSTGVRVRALRENCDARKLDCDTKVMLALEHVGTVAEKHTKVAEKSSERLQKGRTWVNFAGKAERESTFNGGLYSLAKESVNDAASRQKGIDEVHVSKVAVLLEDKDTTTKWGTERIAQLDSLIKKVKEQGDKKKQEKTTEKQEKTTANQKLTTDLQKLTTDLQKVENEAKAAEKERDKVRKTLAAEKKKLELKKGRANGDVEKLNKDKTELEKKADKLTEETSDLRQEADDLERETAHLADALQAMKDSRAAAEQALQEKRAAVDQAYEKSKNSSAFNIGRVSLASQPMSMIMQVSPNIEALKESIGRGFTSNIVVQDPVPSPSSEGAVASRSTSDLGVSVSPK